MFGLSFPQDRQWQIKVGSRTFLLREYNDEITGYDAELHALAPDVIHYGGNAYYATGKFAQQNGWEVTQLPRNEDQNNAKR